MDSKLEVKKESDSSDLSDNESTLNYKDNKEKLMEEDDEYMDEDEDESHIDKEENLSISYGSAQTYRPTFDERKKIGAMRIELRHTPPPQHTIEKTAGTRVLGEADKEQFEKYIPLRIGTFSQEEDKIIKQNWKAFCKLHNWDSKNPKPFLFMKHKSKEFLLRLKNRIKFVQFLADGLNDRSLYSVYHRFRVMYEPHKTSRYKPEEDNVILNYIKNYDNDLPDRKFADLAQILKRTRASVWRRYRVLRRKQSKR